MARRMGARGGALALCLALALSLLGGCARQEEKSQRQLFAMDTVMTLTLYGEGAARGAEEILNGSVQQIQWLEDFWSAVRPEGDVARVNAAGGAETEVAAPTASLLRQSLELCAVTGGALDITAYPAVKAWGFIDQEYRVPSQAELAELAGRIDYRQVSVDEGTRDGETVYTVTLPAGMELDLGAVAKGRTADLLAEGLAADGVSSALLDLGQSTIRAVGEKPDGSSWRIAVQDPAGTGYLGVLELADLAVGTSGGYQRYFEQDGVTYWHILDPDTAAPARSGLAAVTVVSPSALTCDALSTALFVLGLEEGVQLWRDHPELEFQALFITDEGELYLTQGLEDAFSLTEGYEDREVTVLS